MARRVACWACGRLESNPTYLGHLASNRRVPLCQRCGKNPAARQKVLDWYFAELVEASRDAWDGVDKNERQKQAKKRLQKTRPDNLSKGGLL